LHHFILIILIFTVAARAQTKISNWDFHYQYESEKFVDCKYRLQDQQDSIKVFLKLTFDATNKKFKNLRAKETWSFDYRISTSYESRKGIYNNYAYATRLMSDKNEFVFSFSVPKVEESSVYLFLVIYEDEDDGYIQDIPLIVLDRKMYSKYLAFDPTGIYPQFEDYVNKKDTIRVKTATNKNSELMNVGYYKYNFQPALPPMSSVNIYDNELKLVEDSSFQLIPDSLMIFSRKGNYSIGSEGEKKLNFIALDNRFPKVSKVKELTDPVIYIATDDERKKIRTSAKPKARLDDFWMDLGQDKEFARKMIKNYYQKVQNANHYFTCHKEGWKTDMGMVYIIFGKPDEVFRNDYKETWNFGKRANLPGLRFVFFKRLGPFGDIYYELENNPDYAEVWYSTVEMWRRGIME
jgi:GWxTD domain-containing protein